MKGVPIKFRGIDKETGQYVYGRDNAVFGDRYLDWGS